MKNALFLLILLLFIPSFAFTQTTKLGDVNNSGSIDILDALMVAQVSVGQNPTNFNALYADVNCSGTIDIIDALMIAQFSVGLITTFPCNINTPTPTRTSTPVNTAVKGSEVLFIGDSVIALSRDITKFVTQLAKNDGVLAANDSFRDNSVSGTRLAGGMSPTIPQQYANAKQSSPVKWVFMDGGGNDCLQGSCPNPVTSSCTDLQNATTALRNLYTQMGTDGVINVIYFFYYDSPAGPQAKLDVLQPMIQNVANSSVKPKVFFIDLQPVFAGHPEYIGSDNLHPSATGSQAIANAIWDVVKKNNFFGN